MNDDYIEGEDDYIEGELAHDEPRTAVATRTEQAVQVFNPLDHEPVAFSRGLVTRQQNYDALQSHLEGVLVKGKDYGKIHVKKCDNKFNCTNPYHFSGWELFSPGADKILGILGLGVHYPDIGAYRTAAIEGRPIQDVLTDCHILGHSGQVIAEGTGACSRDKVEGDLNRTIKMACKRARLDAVKRLPVVSALFESDFFDRTAGNDPPPSATARGQKVDPVKKWDQGAVLEVCPISKKYKGMKWRDIPTDALQWMAENVNDKPDVLRAVTAELAKRGPATTDSGSIRTPLPPSTPEDEYLSDRQRGE